MRRLFIALGVTAVLALLIIVALSALARAVSGPSYDPVAAQRAELQIATAEALAPLDVAVAAAWKLIPLFALLGGLAYLGALGCAHVKRFLGERRADARGLLPVPADELGELGRGALVGYHSARLAEAQRALPPHSLHYAPHYGHRADAPGALALPALQPAGEPPAAVPSFGELLSAGRIGRGQPLLLGFDLAEGSLIWGTWRDLYSAGVGGAQGGGKSWTAASLIAQSMMNGARVILCDPHAGDTESLTTRLAPLLPYMLLHAEDERQILEAARYAADELGRRREKKSNDRTPILLVIDEWTSLLRRGLAEKLPIILADLCQEGRKYGVNALLLAQRWSVEAAGGGDVRNTLTAHYVHRTRADEARMQTGLRGGALPDDTMTLQPGQSYLVDTRGNVRKVSTPTMSAADLGHVAGLLGPPARVADVSAERAQEPPPNTSTTRHLRVVYTSADDVYEASERATAPDAEVARLLAAFASGKSVHELASDLAGTSNTNATAYRQARARVEHLLRSTLGQRGA